MTSHRCLEVGKRQVCLLLKTVAAYISLTFWFIPHSKSSTAKINILQEPESMWCMQQGLKSKNQASDALKRSFCWFYILIHHYCASKVLVSIQEITLLGPFYCSFPPLLGWHAALKIAKTATLSFTNFLDRTTANSKLCPIKLNQLQYL